MTQKQRYELKRPKTGYESPLGVWRYVPQQAKYLSRDVDPYIDGIEAENRKMSELLLKLKPYLQHRIPCPVTMTGAPDCYCKLEELWIEAERLMEGK